MRMLIDAIINKLANKRISKLTNYQTTLVLNHDIASTVWPVATRH